jgi:hypothetical protein
MNPAHTIKSSPYHQIQFYQMLHFNISPRSMCGGTLLVAQLVEALRYKPEDRGFDSRWCH